GLDRPLLTQFSYFLRAVARGDLGGSIEHNGRPVTTLIRERLGASVILGGTVLLLNFTLGIWLGVWQASHRGRRGDRWIGVATLTTYAMPSFWLGLLLAWAAAVELRWLPPGFMHDPALPADAGWLIRQLDLLRHLVLPALTLSLVTIAATARYQRAAMVDALQLDCIRTARTKGIPERTVRWRHAWRNALGPMLALFGLWLPILVAGSVFVESVFSWPGVGSLAWQAIGSRDYPVIMGTTLLVAALVVGGNLFADLAHRLVDPRLRQ
ncbi:MAG TPA: ABC transporter permease, partial [Gemmatimonadales bacterium]|nr:ABC transporter permease [Gemmatimonadales bacterium]